MMVFINCSVNFVYMNKEANEVLTDFDLLKILTSDFTLCRKNAITQLIKL